MKQLIRLVCLWCVAGLALAEPAPMAVPPAPNIDAKSYFLQDFFSGVILAEKNADQRLEPASLTKLLTAYAVFTELRIGNLHLDDRIRISPTAWRSEGSRMFVQVDTLVTIEDLLRGMIIQSGNDATVALAEHLGGSEEAFATIMNEHARRLGMTSSHFVNATGLPHPDHYSTARDIAKLARAIIYQFPEYYRWYSEKSFTYNKIQQYNRNRLLWQDESVDGMKTGHTEGAGYCLVSSARKGDMRLIAVVLGTPSENARAQESAELLGYGFRFFETRRIYDAFQPLKTAHVWKGAREEVALGLGNELFITAPRGQYGQLKAALTVERVIQAPVRKSQRLGTLSVSLGDKVLAERPLIAIQEVDQGGIWRKAVDSLMLLLE